MNRHEFEYHARRHGLFALLCLSLVLFVLPLVLRSLNGSFITPGAESFTYLRQANAISNGVISQDLLHGNAIAPNPYSILLAFMGVFGVPWILPFLLTLLFVVLLYHYLERVVTSRATIIIALIVIVVSPSTSVLATHHSTILLCLVLLLVAVMIIEERPVLGCGVLFFAFIASPVVGILGLLFLAGTFFLREQYHAFIGVLLTVACGLAWFVFWTGHLPMLTELLAPHAQPRVLFELGNPSGISLFILIIAVYGIVVKYKHHNRLIMRSVILLAATLFIPSLAPVAAVALAVFAGIGISHLLGTRWDLDLLRVTLLWLVFCIALFLSITAMRERISETPNPEFTHTLINLRNLYHEGSVLTEPSYAPMVEYFTGRKASLDMTTPQSVVDAAFHSRSSDVVYALLTNTDTAYVLITGDMRRSTFRRSDEGLLFLLQNSERFVKLDEDRESSLWYFIAQKK